MRKYEGVMINKEKMKKLIIGILLPILMVTTTGCSGDMVQDGGNVQGQQVVQEQENTGQVTTEKDKTPNKVQKPNKVKKTAKKNNQSLANRKYKGEPYVVVNGNKTTFTKKELNLKNGYENYPELDHLGRCKTVIAKVGLDTMPTEDRKGIGMVKPTGWHTVRYDNLISDRYLYNRCHLIGFQLAGENANENNLITGTRYLNVEGMLPFEDQVADYVHETGNHVIYKVTPVYKGNNLVASGVKMSARSVEDKGRGLEFNVYCFNVQPGVVIDYRTGDSREAGTKAGQNTHYNSSSSSNKVNSSAGDKDYKVKKKYVINTNTGKYHDPSCHSVESMSESNKKVMKTTKKELERQGYEPCGNCQR